MRLARRVTWQLMLTATGRHGHMGGLLLNGNPQAGRGTAKALRAKACGIDGVQQFLFQRCIIRVGVGFVQRAQQRLFGQRCAVVEAAADADTQHNGRAGVGSGLLHRVKHEFFHALDAVGWLEQWQGGSYSHCLRPWGRR